MALSARLAAVVDALPLRPDMRVLEIGCGPGAAARAVAERLTTGHVLAIDRHIAGGRLQRFAEGVDRARADIAKHNTERAKHQQREFFSGVVSFGSLACGRLYGRGGATVISG